MKAFFPLQLNDLVLDVVESAAEREALWAFRHKIFREQLGWVPVCEDGLDRDDYDDFSDNLALYRAGEVVGAIRLTGGESPFMLEAEFSRLLPRGETIVKGREYSEITRLAIDREALGGRESVMAARMLYLGAWLWSRIRGVRWMYFVVQPVFYRRLVMFGFPIVPVGVPLPLDGGVMSMTGLLDWRQAPPELIHSLCPGVSVSDACQALWREYDYSH
ncbi:acyl-homoserine-lactone synthase [Chromobacterium paludis]|uniref:Acyl-homoserine-lactone synthase n=1 Tax=Chromobacterium paludis TaxID=2605945 RepID=A0A5C1DNQ7_9NEIS|nr:acyl-homoserine-lactone synthase [Chromobacterium paludis]QEL57649.1 GNAT family N-acetyltransferase [Chromobacterium paludis]